MPDETEFAMYRGDKFIDIGTRSELMERYNIPERTWNYANQETAFERCTKVEGSELMLIIKLDDE